MKNKIDRACPICSCSEKIFIFKQKFSKRTIFLMEDYDVVACKQCGFSFADKIPSQIDFDGYYSEMSKYEFNYRGGRVSDEYVDYFAKIVEFLVPHIKRDTAILDVGCSTGGLLNALKTAGYSNVFGLDPSSACSKATMDLYGIRAIAGTIYDFDPVKKFDLIILSAVLEHLVDFDGSMKKIRALLNENGLLFISVPDTERFSQYIFSPFQQFSTEHINYFSSHSLKNLLSYFLFEEVDTQKDTHKLGQTTDPEILNLSRKIPKGTPRIIRDNITERCLRDYVFKCFEKDLSLKQILDAKLLNKDKVIVWGVGTHTQRIINNGLDISKVLFFVDSNKRYLSKRIDGLEIKQPAEIKEQIPILISTHAYQNEIINQIKNVLKLNNEIITLY